MQLPRDPRIIDLAQGTAPGPEHNLHLPQSPPVQNGLLNGFQNGPPTQPGYPTPAGHNGYNAYPSHINQSNFNTLPNHSPSPALHPTHLPAHPHNTLPARVGESPPRNLQKPGK